MRIITLSLALVVLLGLTLAGCSKPAAPTAPSAAPPEAQTPQTAPATAPDAAAPPPEAGAKDKAAGGEAADKGKAVGPKVKGEEGKPVQTSKTGLKYIVLDKGTGPQPKKGDTILAEYTGWLTDGTKFDSSKDHPGPGFSFAVGNGEVIPAWDEALLSMKVGERRKLIVPPELGYGPTGAPPVIPADATLIFEVTLVKIK